MKTVENIKEKIKRLKENQINLCCRDCEYETNCDMLQYEYPCVCNVEERLLEYLLKWIENEKEP